MEIRNPTRGEKNGRIHNNIRTYNRKNLGNRGQTSTHACYSKSRVIETILKKPSKLVILWKKIQHIHRPIGNVLWMARLQEHIAIETNLPDFKSLREPEYF